MERARKQESRPLQWNKSQPREVPVRATRGEFISKSLKSGHYEHVQELKKTTTKELNTEKRMKQKEVFVKTLDALKCTNIRVMGVPRKKERSRKHTQRNNG